MKRFVIGLVLVVMAVFSLSADETLKQRRVNNAYEGRADVFLNKTVDPGKEPYYSVIWWMDDGTDVVHCYDCASLEQAFNVWSMDRYELESVSQMFGEETYMDDKFGLLLLKYYRIKTK